MAVVKQGGQPYSGKVWTSNGPKDRRPPVCAQCRERREGLYTISVNGQLICGQCSGEYGRGILTPDEDSPYDVGPPD